MRKALPFAICALGALLIPACGGGGGGGGPGVPFARIVQGSVDITAGTVTISSPATGYVTSGTSMDNGGGNATVDLTILSNQLRKVFNLKAVIRVVSDGTATGDGTYDGDPYVYFGPGALSPGANAMAPFTMAGLGGTTFDFTIELLDHPMLFFPHDYPGSEPTAIDSSGSGQIAEIDIDPLAFDNGGLGGPDTSTVGGVVGPDGCFLYCATSNQPGILVVDLETLTPVLSTDLTGAGNIQHDGSGSVGMLGGIAMSPSGTTLYTVLTEGCHRVGAVGLGSQGRAALTTTVSLIKIDRATLVETSRIQLFSGPPNGMGWYIVGHGPCLSPDGTRAAVPLTNAGEVWVVNTAGAMSLYDADLGMGGNQPFDVSAHTMRPRHCAFGPLGIELFVGHGANSTAGDNGELDRINLTTRTIGTLALPASFAAFTGGETGDLEFGPDNRLYYVHTRNNMFPALTIYDFVGAAWSEHFTGAGYLQTWEIVFHPDGQSYFLGHDGALPVRGAYRYQIGTDVPVPSEADGGHPIVDPDMAQGHFGCITPF